MPSILKTPVRPPEVLEGGGGVSLDQAEPSLPPVRPAQEYRSTLLHTPALMQYCLCVRMHVCVCVCVCVCVWWGVL